MKTESIIELQENALQLVVSEKALGSLTTNAKQIRDIVKAGIGKYNIANYDESNIDIAKKDKALLTGAAKALNAKRLEIEREFMQPLGEFKEIVAETINLIADCSAKIDTVVKQSEEKAKEQKGEAIQRYFDNKGFTFVSLDKIFDSRWLNKTVKEKVIYAEIDEKITRINDDITTLEAIGEDVDLLKSLYLDTLNINTTIQYANKLKQNRERAKAEENRKNTMPPPSENIPVREPEEQTETKEVQTAPEPETSASVELITRAFMVKTTRDNIIALGNFMNDRGIDFKRIEL
jgi:hypothetical protein